jgi:hypothetical protein
MLSEGLPGKPNDFILLGSGHLPFLTGLSQLVVSTIFNRWRGCEWAALSIEALARNALMSGYGPKQTS